MQLRSCLLPLYCIAVLFPRLLSLPEPLQQVQLTELLFPFILWSFRQEIIRTLRQYPIFFTAAGCYVAANLVSASLSGDASALLEASARGYLVLLSGVVIAHTVCYGRKQLSDVWLAGTILVAILGLVGYFLYAITDINVWRWVATFQDYPYLGEVTRLRGTAQVYGMWVMLLLPGFCLAVAKFSLGQIPLWAALLIAAAILPTLSKEILLLLIAAILLSSASVRQKWLWGTMLSILLWGGTHYIVTSADTAQASGYTSGQTSIDVLGLKVVESVYLPIKRVGLRVGEQNPWFGVGPGKFHEQSTSVVFPGELPQEFGSFDPHSTWTGAFAETGLVGSVGLIFVIVALFYHRPASMTVWATVALLFLIVSIFKDVMNFRGLWVIIGLYLATSKQPTG